MRFFLDNDNAISDHDVVTAILRQDLVPIPLTLELVVNAVPEIQPFLVAGRSISMANGVRLVIVKSECLMGQKILEGRRTGAIVLTAVLAGCENLIHASTRAVNLKNPSFSEIYRACGAKVRITDDMKVNQFVCFKGQMATVRIAWALQKEAACVVYDLEKQALGIRRIADLLNGTPHEYDPSAVRWLSHAHSDGDIAPYHLSVDKDGSKILGVSPDDGRMDYLPRCDERELANLSRVLIARGTIQRQLDERLVAGNMVQVADKRYLVATSAILYQSGAFGGNSNLSIKAWLYDLGAK